MKSRRRGNDPHLPISAFLEASIVRPSPAHKRREFKGRPLNQGILFFVAIALTVTGVAASVAITIRGNSATQNNVISLGVGAAKAESCNNDTAIKTDTISEWDDNFGDFTLQRVDVTGVQSSCQNHAMKLVIAMSSGPDLNVSCSLPATGSDVYSQGTFVFATQTFTTSGSQYGCPAFSYPLYMASISAAAIEIK